MVHAELSERIYSIIGAAMRVHSELKHGLLESVYQESLAIELGLRDIPHESEKLIRIYYRGIPLEKYYRADIVCYDDIILELKAVDKILPEHRAQLFNYLRLTKAKIGILMNFGDNSFKSETYSYNQVTNQCEIFYIKK
ncbi:MAG: GxxExxY protein [Bacteroidaceae bacterium]|nr:GxxExxY protein [Bacteroidaceae bacterium]